MSITIKPVRFAENGFMTRPFALGGEGAEGLDPAVKYRSCLQNWVIDTGSEVILVDTGLPAEFPDAAPTPDATIYVGTKIKSYLEALADLGYKPEQVSKILITHKHPDHTGALEYFPNAKVYISPEDADALKLEGGNVIRAEYGKAYKNFPNAMQVADGIWFIEAKGHTNGNSIVIAEDGELFYLFHDDVTYCDAALKANKLSIVFEDIKAARETLDRVREFVKKHPTVYLSTHCPEGYENLEMKRVMKLPKL